MNDGARPSILAMLLGCVLSGCAALPRSAPGENGAVADTAPRLAEFQFAGEPIAPSSDFSLWKALEDRTASGLTAFETCLERKETCATPDLVRFRRLLELARDLKPRQQVNLVQAYFNAVAWTSEDRDTWLPLVQVAAGRRGDCEDVALAKYATLRRLGWAADSLRVVVGWDAEEHDWHAWLLVDDAGAVQVLDSIKEPQTLRHFHASRAVYSISELGVWDHAPDFVPVAADHDPERAARFAALDRKGDSK